MLLAGVIGVGERVAAGFSGTAQGGASARAAAVPAAAQPAATAAGRDVTVSWPATTLTGGIPATSYSVRRYDSVGAVVATLTSCATGGLTSCVDSNVPTGSFRYSVQAGFNAWNGAEGPLSASVVVSPQSFVITSNTTVAVLPAVVTATLSNYAVGETLSYRLDSPTGTVLTGLPGTVTSGVSQPVTIALPVGTSDTVHSIFVVGSNGSAASAALRIVMPPTLQSLTMSDSDSDGKVDRVVATFSEPLSAYDGGTTPWTLSNGPSGATLTSVNVSGSTATLTLTEGSGAADTSVGALTVALTESSSGIRDSNDNLSSFGPTTPVDGAAPVLVVLTMLDVNFNGKVDRVTASFSENLANYSAGTIPWTSANVPSGGSLRGVSVSGDQATLTFTEGSGRVHTAVGSMSIALASSSMGIRDSAANLSSFSPFAPTDGAAPIPVSITDTNGAYNGRFEPGDTMSVTFSEALLASTVPSSTTATITDPSGSGSDTLTIAGITSGARRLGSNGYNTVNNTSAAFSASAVTLTNGDRTVTVTIGPTCTGTGCAGLATQSTAASFSFLAATSVTDVAGIASTKVLVVNLRLC